MRHFGGDWTSEKLERVRKYLPAYTTALKNQGFRLIYVDAFAGAGYCPLPQDCSEGDLLFPEFSEEETQRFIAGSARLALQVEPPFSEYLFIERSGRNVADLEQLKSDFPQRIVRVSHGDANEQLKGFCANLRSMERAVVFLDPYGMQVNWDTLRAIAGTKAVDLWYLFPLVAVNRCLRRDGRIDETVRQRLDQLFGNSDWYDVFYQTNESLGLFGSETSTSKVADFQAVSDYLVSRLKSEFAGVAKNPLPLLNSKNNPLYLLCFACANPTGARLALRVAESILGK